MSVHRLLEEVLHEAGYSGQDEQAGGSWGGNNPISPEVAVLQQLVLKEEGEKGEATQLGTKEAAESTRQEKGQQREEEAAPAGC